MLLHFTKVYRIFDIYVTSETGAIFHNETGTMVCKSIHGPLPGQEDRFQKSFDSRR